MSVTDVNQLVERFGEAQKVMRRLRDGKFPGMRGGGMPGLPAAGMPGMPPGPGAGSKKSRGKQQASRGRKGRSGNPAKRAEQERQQPVAAPGSAFGLGQQPNAEDLENLELPPGFEKFLR